MQLHSEKVKKWGSLTLAIVLLAAGAAIGEDQTGRFPFFPSLLNSKTNGPISADLFLTPAECRGCHGDIYNQWRGSMHSLARRDPVFLALWEKGAREAGEATGQLCAGCHAAPAVLSRNVKLKDSGGFDLPQSADAGVSCHICHSITSSVMKDTPSGLPQNASIIFDPGLTMRGQYSDANPIWHKAEYSELHTKAEFCGNCHNVFHPVSGFRIENTYTEWKNSVYAEKGIVCQDCHMMPFEKSVEAAATLTRPQNPGFASKIGPKRPNVFTHEFVGANYTVTALSGFPEKAALAKKRIKSAAKIAITAPAEAKRATPVKFKLRVTNIGAGHNLPTSLTEVRQIWLDVKVEDGDGRGIFSSGQLDGEGELPHDARSFGAEAVDSEGKPTVLPWKMDKFARFNTIPPKGFADEEFAFTPDGKAKGPLKISAVLRYRSYSQKLARELLGANAPTIEIVDMTTDATTVKLQD